MKTEKMIRIIFVVTMFLVFNSTVFGVPIIRTVPSPYVTIQQAIDAAVDGDIVIVADGTYTASGNYNIDFNGQAITVKSENGPQNCIIDCQDQSGRRGFYFHSGEEPNSVVSGFTIKGGRIGGSDARGGGIYCTGSSPTIANCNITNNKTEGQDAGSGGSALGGGICCVSGSNAIINNCIITSNSAIGGQGGNSYRSPFTGECSPAGPGGDAMGGGIYIDSSCSIMINKCVISNNFVKGGPDGDDYDGCGTMGSGNSCGGGVYGYVTISNSTISSNTAEMTVGGLEGYNRGGGIYCLNGSLIVNCLITDNFDAYTHSLNGGGIFGSGMTVTNCTIAGNDKDGIRGDGTSVISDCIIWDNEDDLYSCSATYSCIEDGDSGTGNISSDPLFVTGPSGSYYLSQTAAGQGSDSPCVDAGSEPASSLGMDVYTTRTDNITDSGIVDIGYHYPVWAGDLSDGPIAHWKLDEGAGVDANDSAGNNDGILINGPTWVEGKIGDYALDFDGVDDYVALPDNDPVWLPTQDFTSSCWVYFHREVGFVEMLLDLNQASSGDPGNELGYSLHRKSDTGELFFGMTTATNPDEDLLSNTITVKEKWYHIVAVRDGTFQAIYVNGQLDNSRICSPDTIDFVGGYDDDKVSIGRFSRNGVASDFHLDGLIDDVRIYDRALSAEDIQELYYEGLDGLVAHWKLDEGGGDTAVDSAGSNDGTLINDPCWVTGQVGNYALDFDGVDDYVDCGNDESLDVGGGNFTIVAWAKRAVQTDDFVVVAKRLPALPEPDGPLTGWIFKMRERSGNRELVLWESEEWGNSYPYPFDADIWYHIAAVRNKTNSQVTFYIDGESKATLYFSNADLSNSAKLSIGRQSEEDLGYANGKIDDVRIYDRALSAEEIQQLWYDGWFKIYYIDDNAAGDPGPGDPAVSDPDEDGTQAHPFDSIQEGIDVSQDGHAVMVQPGQYLETNPFAYGFISLDGKNITLTSTDPADWDVVDDTIIGGTVFFDGTEDANCVFTGFKISHSNFGIIYGNGTQAAISHCIISGNGPCGATVINDCDGIISNCLITDNTTFAFCGVSPIVLGCNGLITNCTIANNISGVGEVTGGSMTIANSIIYNNGDVGEPQIGMSGGGTLDISYCNIQEGLGGVDSDGTVNWGLGNIDADPLFVRLGEWIVEDLIEGNYHLKSFGWRLSEYDPGWTYDFVTSRCIDAGNPGSPLADELMAVPRDPGNDYGINLRINMGAYGGTNQASMAPYDWALLCDSNNDGIADSADLTTQADDWLTTDNQQPGDLNRDGIVNLVDFAALAGEWIKVTDWAE